MYQSVLEQSVLVSKLRPKAQYLEQIILLSSQGRGICASVCFLTVELIQWVTHLKTLRPT